MDAENRDALDSTEQYHIGSVPLEAIKEVYVPPADENWDEDPLVQTYDPLKNARSRGLLIPPVGLSSTRKKALRKAERLRFLSQESEGGRADKFFRPVKEGPFKPHFVSSRSVPQWMPLASTIKEADYKNNIIKRNEYEFNFKKVYINDDDEEPEFRLRPPRTRSLALSMCCNSTYKGKNEEDKEKNSSSDRIKLITEKKQFLEDTSAQVQDEIKKYFKRLVDVLKSREIQLLRQVEAIHRQQLSLVQSNLELHSSIPSLIVNLSRAQDLEKEVSQFGRVELSDNCIINDAEPYKAEDYQEANSDHVSFDKELQTEEREIPSSVDLANPRIESKEKNVSSISWDLNSTKLMNIQLIDEDLDESSWMINSVTHLVETNDCSLCNRDTENSIEGNSFMIEEKNSLLEKNKEKDIVDVSEKKEFCRNHNVSADDSEHPKQVQQWLQQILVETETEPTVPEIEQFSEIPKRVYVDFPLEI